MMFNLSSSDDVYRTRSNERTVLGIQIPDPNEKYVHGKPLPVYGSGTYDNVGTVIPFPKVTVLYS
jgi:hypothetical protein